MKTVRAAVVQSAPVVFDREQTLKKACELIADATAWAAELIVFPEAYVSGYPRGLDFGVRIGSRTPDGRELFRRYWKALLTSPGRQPKYWATRPARPMPTSLSA